MSSEPPSEPTADPTADPRGATVRVRVVVHGRVQGVWFRAFTREEALARGVVGWVRNRPDGAVEAVAEGSRGAVDGWLAAVRQGPPLAAVTELEIRDETSRSPLEGFRVIR